MFQSFVQKMYKKERLEQTFTTVENKKMNFFSLFSTHSTHKQRRLLMLVLLEVINGSKPNSLLQSSNKHNGIKLIGIEVVSL